MSEAPPGEVVDALAGHLGGQRWFGGQGPTSASTVTLDGFRELWRADGGERRLLQLIAVVGGAPYQLLVGERPAGDRVDFLRGHPDAVLSSPGASYFYDATLDSEMSRELLRVASAGKQEARLCRPVAAEQSNTSLVFDDRLILKVFRRLHEGRNPDVEVTTALADVGFGHVAEPLVTWRDDRYDLAFGQRYLSGGSEGWAMAVTSLRDLYGGSSEAPAEAGGDFASEASRLGRVTAEMHIALQAVFGRAPAGEATAFWEALVAGLPSRLEEASDAAGRDLTVPAVPLLERLRAVGDPGPAIRVHGDFHLGQVMLTDMGWAVLDFEGEPSKPLHERTARSSPMKDVTGMLRSLHYASRHALIEHPEGERQALEPLAQSWESHNRTAYLDGYMQVDGAADLLPPPGDAAAVIVAYELDKGLYELGYELRHRPEWAPIPLGAIENLVAGEVRQ